MSYTTTIEKLPALERSAESETAHWLFNIVITILEHWTLFVFFSFVIRRGKMISLSICRRPFCSDRTKVAWESRSRNAVCCVWREYYQFSWITMLNPACKIWIHSHGRGLGTKHGNISNSNQHISISMQSSVVFQLLQMFCSECICVQYNTSFSLLVTLKAYDLRAVQTWLFWPPLQCVVTPDRETLWACWLLWARSALPSAVLPRHGVTPGQKSVLLIGPNFCLTWARAQSPPRRRLSTGSVQ